MRIVDNKIVLEKRNCVWCKGTKESNELILCPRDGCLQRGKKCQHCGTKTKHHTHLGLKKVPCKACKEQGTVPESYTDILPDSWIQNVNIIVRRSKRVQSSLESYLGAGIYTVVDYGVAWESNDDKAIIDKLRKKTWIQACKVVRSADDLRVCDAVIISLCRTGYSAFAFFNPEKCNQCHRETTPGLIHCQHCKGFVDNSLCPDNK